jgi:cytochrome b
MRQVKVWDPFVRLSHWGLGLLLLGSFLTSDDDRLTAIHVRVGLTVLALVLARVAWGFLGSEPARFRAFVRRPREVLAYARELALGRPRRHLSHNPLGGAMVVALLAVLLGIVVTGAIAYAGPEFAGPLTGLVGKRTAHAVKEVHEGLSGLLVGMIAVHVAGVLFSSWRERQNLVAGMVTGWKRAPEERAEPEVRAPGRLSRLARLAAAVAVGAFAAVSLALLLGLPARAGAAGPVAADLLREYEARARRERPALRSFSADEGRRLYFSEHVQDGEKVSCSSCHTADPRKRGLTPAGKVVEPLAPSANPDRLTDRREVEKWFKRNCKQVLGRECTAEEKGHFLTFLLGA